MCSYQTPGIWSAKRLRLILTIHRQESPIALSGAGKKPIIFIARVLVVWTVELSIVAPERPVVVEGEPIERLMFWLILDEVRAVPPVPSCTTNSASGSSQTSTRRSV